MTEKYPSCEERIDDEYKREMDRIAEVLVGPEYRCLECGHTWHDEHCNEPDECPECYECYGLDGFNFERERDVETREDYEQGILEFSKETVYTVLLSTGGPADGFHLRVDDGYITGADYFFQDWFDGAVKLVTRGDLEKLRDMFGYLVELDNER